MRSFVMSVNFANKDEGTLPYFFPIFSCPGNLCMCVKTGTDLTTTTKCPWLKGLNTLSLVFQLDQNNAEPGLNPGGLQLCEMLADEIYETENPLQTKPNKNNLNKGWQTCVLFIPVVLTSLDTKAAPCGKASMLLPTPDQPRDHPHSPPRRWSTGEFGNFSLVMFKSLCLKVITESAYG